MSLVPLIILGVIVAVALFFIGTYNSLVTQRQNVRESWSAIETELRRRYDLIPNIVETVKGYASHERETLEAVIAARNSAHAGGTIEQQVSAQNALGGALTKLMALSEAYPQLKANENFNQLQQELGDTETRISQARRFYNANVKELNTSCEMFPSSMVAGIFHIHHEPYYGNDDPAASEPVRISFTSMASAPGDGTQTLKLPQQQPREDK